LDFVNHHQTLQRLQGELGLGQARHAFRVFEIEVVERIGRHELPGQCRLAALART
jgi:hypothetical protein